MGLEFLRPQLPAAGSERPDRAHMDTVLNRTFVEVSVTGFNVEISISVTEAYFTVLASPGK